MDHAYWGPAYPESAMQEAIQSHGLTARRVDDVAQQTARLLADGHVIGWYQGRMEWGPRALGNRSILADPRRADMKDVINSKIKFREPYRPFAPSVLEEDVDRYFHFSGASPFMTFVCRVREERQEQSRRDSCRRHGAHPDRLAHPQPGYWSLIDAFKTLTGVPVVLNTSFNVKGEPIVCTPEDAVRCFLKTDLDYLVLGDTICSRG